MTDIDVMAEIAKEYDGEDFSGEFRYAAPKRPPTPMYKPWNPPLGGPVGEPTPGIVMRTRSLKDAEGNSTTNEEIVDKVNAVILFQSSTRQLARGSGKAFRVVCESFDGHTPALKVAEPLCGKATSKDVAQLVGQWKNMDQARVDAILEEHTRNGQLITCGMKAANGHIMLCPYARKDELTGTKAPCKPGVHVRGYDLDRKRTFMMDLKGSSIDNHAKFIAPFHEFFKFLRSNGPEVDGKRRGLPCYAFTVELSALMKGGFYLLNVKNYQPITDAELRDQMRTMAVAEKEAHAKRAAYIAKKDFDEAKKREAEAKNATFTAQTTSTPSTSVDDDEINWDVSEE